MQFLLILGIQTETVGVLIILGADHLKGMIIIDGATLISKGVETLDSKLAEESYIVSSLKMCNIAMS